MNRLLPTILLILAVSIASTNAEEIRASTSGTIGLMERPATVTWKPVRAFYRQDVYDKLLLGALRDADAETRARSAFLLGSIGSPKSRQALVPLLNDPERIVRVFAGLALGFLGDERGIHVCDAVLKADPTWIRYQAVYALWCIGTTRATSVLKRNLSGNTPLIRKTIEAALADSREKAVAARNPRAADEPADLQGLFEGACDLLITESDVWWHEGDYDQTIRCLETAVFLDPEYTEGYSLIAWLQWSMGDDAAAIRTLNRGIRAVPDSPDAHGALGQHYWMTKRYAHAEEPLRRAVELGGDHLVRRPYALTLEKMGKLQESLAQWEAIEKECPNDPAAPVNIERLKKLLGEQN